LGSRKEKFESFAICNLEDVFVGVISLRSINGCPENWASIGYWLGKAHWGNGIGTEAVLMVSDYAFRKLNIIKLEAYVFGVNVASIRVLEKNGFKFESVLRSNCDLGGIISDELIYSKYK
jgi:RimJ/RimL family protein N-acetyltransferase